MQSWGQPMRAGGADVPQPWKGLHRGKRTGFEVRNPWRTRREAVYAHFVPIRNLLPAKVQIPVSRVQV